MGTTCCEKIYKTNYHIFKKKHTLIYFEWNIRFSLLLPLFLSLFIYLHLNLLLLYSAITLFLPCLVAECGCCLCFCLFASFLKKGMISKPISPIYKYYAIFNKHTNKRCINRTFVLEQVFAGFSLFLQLFSLSHFRYW